MIIRRHVKQIARRAKARQFRRMATSAAAKQRMDRI